MHLNKLKNNANSNRIPIWHMKVGTLQETNTELFFFVLLLLLLLLNACYKKYKSRDITHTFPMIRCLGAAWWKGVWIQNR
jgi:hypothetical protein